MVNATWDVHISALEGSRASIFALGSKSHGPLSESRVLRRLEAQDNVQACTVYLWYRHMHVL